MTTPDKIHDTLDRAIESSAEHTDWLRQLRLELRELTKQEQPDEHADILSLIYVRELLQEAGFTRSAEHCQTLITRKRAEKMLAGMHAATAARHDQSELSRPKREGVQG